MRMSATVIGQEIFTKKFRMVFFEKMIQSQKSFTKADCNKNRSTALNNVYMRQHIGVDFYVFGTIPNN